MLARQKISARVSFTDLHPAPSDRRRELLDGLAANPRRIDPKFFYDQLGSELFEQITNLPEYYPTRTERQILADNAAAIAASCGRDCILIEPGSGSCEKVRLLLDELCPAVYVPVDISADFLRDAAQQVGEEFPWLHVQALCADFHASEEISALLPEGRRVIFYPGSTIGNLEPAGAQAFLSELAGWIGVDGGVLVGVDLHKSTARLEQAYNDAAGITAAFNRNVLTQANRILDAQFDPDSFAHRAFYDEQRQRIEMHLVSRSDQSVNCAGDTLRFRAGESIHTENSYKYTVAGFTSLAAAAGLRVQHTWLDDEQLFSVHYLQSA